MIAAIRSDHYGSMTEKTESLPEHNGLGILPAEIRGPCLTFTAALRDGLD